MKYFNKYAQLQPITVPIKNEKKNKDKNSFIINIGVVLVNSSPVDVNLRNIRYRTIHTASFNTPSPNRMENNFGSDSSFINVNAAIVSVALITEANNRISGTDSFIISLAQMSLN